MPRRKLPNQLGVVLPPSLVARIKLFARATGRTVSGAVRVAIEEYLGREEHHAVSDVGAGAPTRPGGV